MFLLEEVAVPTPAAPGHAAWSTPCGLAVRRTSEQFGGAEGVLARLGTALDERRGLMLFLGADRAVGYTDPPIEVTVRDDHVAVQALNERGQVLLPALRRVLVPVLAPDPPPVSSERRVAGRVPRRRDDFPEEHRTGHAGVVRAIRALVSGMNATDDRLLGLYGAFGYDLLHQLEPVALHQARDPDDRTLVLHLPDEIVEVDLRRDAAVRHRYEFATVGAATDHLPRLTPAEPYTPGTTDRERDHRPGEYAQLVSRAMTLFRSGDLFEVVPGQVFHRPGRRPPSKIFARLRAHNPAPHNLLMNLGQREYLVGASPEMFVSVRRRTVGGSVRRMVESSPISGTIARGEDALEDAARIQELLGSTKEESELTMCTDVDRNDKSKVCVPGTVRVTARRRIEMYSALIHTVDRVEGQLRDDLDALDAFFAHVWAATVTGAPKLAAVQFIEREERSARRWYGGAVGCVTFDGDLETVLTLRTIHLKDGVATVRAGATLLHDSSPPAEEAETELKAKALLRVLDEEPGLVPPARRPGGTSPLDGPGRGLRVLVVDHQDSFVHCLADYLRQTGAEVTTYRSPGHLAVLERERPDLLVLSPGPGRPAAFGLGATLAAAERLGTPVLGVCLGLQGMVEFCGGSLSLLDRPVHGKPSRVLVTRPDSRLLAGLPTTFDVGRYHSLYVAAAALPPQLEATAATEDGVAMAVEHRQRPWSAVQFHPESIMTAQGAIGHRIIENAVAGLPRGVDRA